MTATVELRMPLCYVELDTEEMEYLDGGAYVWSSLDSSTCYEIALNLRTVGTVYGVASRFLKKIGLGNFGVAFAVAGLIVGAGSWYFRDGARRGGINIMRTGSTWGKGVYYLSRK